MEQCLYARFSRSRDLPRARNVPSIAGSSRVEMDVVICQEHVLCEAGRCGDANGRVVCFYLDSKTSSLIESQPYACYTIAGNLGAATRSNKATWVWSIIQRSVACCQEGGGHRLRCNQDDELAPGKEEFWGQKPAAKRAASRTLSAVSSQLSVRPRERAEQVE